MEKKEKKLKVKGIINNSGENNKVERKQNSASKVSIKSTSVIVSVILIVVMLALIVGTIILSINATNKTEETGMQAMAQKGDYIKNIEKVEEDNKYMTIKTDAENQKVPVPKGYVGSEVEGENKVSRRVCNI